MSNSKTSELATLLGLYRKDPILFFKQQLGIAPDQQQTELILAAVVPGCRIVVKSGRGCGKTTTIAGLALYFLIMFDDVNIRVLSPSEAQLRGVFMREVTKLALNMIPDVRAFYDIKALEIVNKFKEINICKCATAGTDKTENISGIHSDKQIFLIDEASAISDEVYATLIGSLGTAVEDHVICASNPNRGAGTFYSDLFVKKPLGWILLTFTAIKCAFVKDSFIEDMKNLYGEDSDEYRVSVLGEFPRADGSAFIPESIIEDAEERLLPLREYGMEPVILGVDIARSLSGDKTVFIARKGPKIIDIIAFQTADTMETVAKLVDSVVAHGVVTVYGDATGVGGPVLDRAREVFRERNLRIPIIDVVVANRSSDPVQYFNIRAQLWGEMRDWLTQADIPKHYDLKKELAGMTWGYSGKMQIQLTAKKQLRAKGIESPDHADALALTMRDMSTTVRRRVVQPRQIRRSKYLWV